MNPFGVKAHLRLGASSGAGWDADPRVQGGNGRPSVREKRSVLALTGCYATGGFALGTPARSKFLSKEWA